MVRHLHQLVTRCRQLARAAATSTVALRRRWVASVASLVAVGIFGLLVPPPVLGGAHRTGAASAERSHPAPPPGSLLASNEPGRAGAEESALELVSRLGGLPLGTGQPPRELVPDLLAPRAGTCSPLRLRVGWAAPVGNYHVGGYLEPVGPPPSRSTRHVNGVVTCQDSTFAYLGFEALWTGHRWAVTAVPSTSDDDRSRLPADDTAPGLDPAVADVAPQTPAANRVDAGTGWGPAIEPLADYQPQTTCDPTAKPGVVGLRNLLLHSFPGSRDLGIGQACDAPDGVSEHKEGRAFDWGVNVDNPAERAMAEQFLAWLLAPDRYGNRYAMARRLGIMYLIWDQHIWGAYLADQGWRPYSGVSPHTDHIHISFSWAGALGQTSFWSGHVANVGLVPAPPGAVPPHDAGVAAPAPGSPPTTQAPGSSEQAAPAPGLPGPGPAAQPSSGDPSSSSPPPTSSSQPDHSTSPSSPTTAPAKPTSTSTTSTSTTSTTAPPSPSPTLPPPPLPFP